MTLWSRQAAPAFSLLLLRHDPAPASRILLRESSCISRGYLPITYCLMHIRAHFFALRY
jgi:hypothetical protein